MDRVRLNANGCTVIPLFGGMIAVVSERAHEFVLQFYDWTRDFTLLASAVVDGACFSADATITVTHDGKILASRDPLSLHVYTLVGTRVRISTLMRVVRDKEWITRESIGEPYYVDTPAGDMVASTNAGSRPGSNAPGSHVRVGWGTRGSRIGAHDTHMCMYVETAGGPVFALCDTGINVHDMEFWCIMRNKIIMRPRENTDKLFHCALVGPARTSSWQCAGACLYNVVVGDATAIVTPTCVYVIWGASGTECDVVSVECDDAPSRVVVFADKFAIVNIADATVYGRDGSALALSPALKRLIMSAEVIAFMDTRADAPVVAPSPRGSPRGSPPLAPATPRHSSPLMHRVRSRSVGSPAYGHLTLMQDHNTGELFTVHI